MPRLDRALICCACVMLAGAGLLVPARAEAPRDTLHAIEKAEAQSRAQRDTLARAAASLKAEIESLRRQSVTVAEAMQRHERALTLLEEQLKKLGAQEQAKAADLRRHQADRQGLLMALVAIARHSPEALALSSGGPIEVERGALVMGRTVPALDRAAHRLSHDLTRLRALRDAIARARAKHRAEQQSLDAQRLRLANLITRKAELEQRAEEGAQLSDQRLAQLAAQAANLKDLIARLDAARRHRRAARRAVQRAAKSAVTDVAALIPPPPKPSPPAQAVAKPETVAAPATIPGDLAKPSQLRPFDDAFGHYLTPVAGTLVGRFGKARFGLTSRGMTYQTRAGAQVVAPFDGRVLFAGAFHGYGQVLIIEHSDGYHSVLAGLERLDVTVGQWLVAGEPVGTMPKDKGGPRLYLELRHDGQPINPLPWLATSNEKVSG